MAQSTVRENERLRLEKDGASLGRWVDWGNHREDKGRQWGRISVITFPHSTHKCSQICKTEGGKLPLWVRYQVHTEHWLSPWKVPVIGQPTHLTSISTEDCSPTGATKSLLFFLNCEAGCFKSNYFFSIWISYRWRLGLGKIGKIGSVRFVLIFLQDLKEKVIQKVTIQSGKCPNLKGKIQNYVFKISLHFTAIKVLLF